MKSKFWFKGALTTFFCFLLLNNLALARNPPKNQADVKKIIEGIYLITGLGGNITAVDGPDEMLVIDAGEKPGKLDSVVSTFSKHPVKYILNTNFHFDHVGGNKLLCDKGATIIAHEKVRDVLAAGWTAPGFPTFPPESAKYLPKVCFKDTLKLFINDHTIQAIHYPNAHSSGDAIFYFKNRNLVHAGDLFVQYGFPYIDSTHGGTLAGLIKAVDDILKLCDDKTIVITGHGALSNRKGLLEYQEMLVASNKIIAKLISEGKTLDEIIKLEPIRKLFKDRKSWFEEGFIRIAYSELTKKGVAN